jgi:hypothetical protein
VILWLSWDWGHALGFLFGGVWSATNLWAMKWLLTEYLKTDRNLLKLLIAAHIKLPVLYGVGALVLNTVPLSIGAGLAGFHVPFVLVVIEAIIYQATAENCSSVK